MNCMVVGNAEPRCDCRRLIDSSDFVIRFNDCRFIGTGRVGSKTNAHVIQNAELRLLNGGVKNVGAFERWILVEERARDFSPHIAIANRLPHYTTIYKDYMTFGPRFVERGASSGLAIIEHLLTAPRFSGWRISIICFTWKGSNWHNWELEKSVCKDHERAGRITIYTP